MINLIIARASASAGLQENMKFAVTTANMTLKGGNAVPSLRISTRETGTRYYESLSRFSTGAWTDIVFWGTGGYTDIAMATQARAHRDQELRWIDTHRDVLRQFAGQWVVLEGEAIIASGPDPLHVVAKARARGVSIPYIFYVEISENNVVRMGL